MKSPSYFLTRLGQPLRAALLSVLLLASAYGQFDSAAVVGAVRDEKGGAIAAAKVTLRNTETGLTLSTETGETGDYLIMERTSKPW